MLVREGGVRVRQVRGAGIGHLSWQGMSEEGVFSQITGTRSLYRSRTRADSATRCSKECSRLCAKLIRIVLLDGPKALQPRRLAGFRQWVGEGPSQNEKALFFFHS